MGVELATNTKMEYIETEDVDLSDLELVSYVRDALKSVSNADFSEGFNDHYSQLIGVINYTGHLAPDEVALLVTSLKAVTKAVSCIDILHHGALLTSIFGMSMWNYGPDVMDALVELIVSLAASSGAYVDLCLDMLVKNFLPPLSFLHLLSQPRGIARKEQVLNRVHAALRDIADLVPLAPLRLNDIVVGRLLQISKNNSLLSLNEIYVENMLRLETGVHGKYLGKAMLSAVVFRLLELDVEIGWDDILQDDSSKGIFDMELEDTNEAAEYDEEDGSGLPKGAFGRQKLGADAFAKKLDSLMVLTCEHIKSCADDGRLIEVFETLLLSFRESILNTHKSKFAQFVIFYACSLDPENCGVRFAVMLADIFVHGTAPLTRMSAVAYLASYLSRARFLPSSLFASTLKRLVDWCSDYCKFQNVEEKRLNPEVHRVFYSGCQAVMYVLCFRMRSMMVVPLSKSQLLRMPLESILRNPLDPLKVCLPSIVMEFLRQAKAAQLFTVSDRFFFNDMLESDLSKTYGGMERLDMFFPFDPILLKSCDRFIRPNFVYWSMVNTTYDDDDEDDNNSSDEDVDEGFVDGNSECFLDDDMGRSFEDQELDLDDFENSMNKMSITPKSSLKQRLGGGIQFTMQMPARIRPSTSPESL